MLAHFIFLEPEREKIGGLSGASVINITHKTFNIKVLVLPKTDFVYVSFEQDFTIDLS